MPRMDRISKYKTKVTTDDSGNYRVIRVKLFNTVVVEIKPSLNKVRLCTGGYRTNTTKNRINQAMKVYGYDIRVFQKNYQWYVRQGNSINEFSTDDMELEAIAVEGVGNV